MNFFTLCISKIKFIARIFLVVQKTAAPLLVVKQESIFFGFEEMAVSLDVCLRTSIGTLFRKLKINRC